MYVKKNGPQQKDAPVVFGPPKTLYNRFVRWSRLGMFARMFVEPAQPQGGQRFDLEQKHASKSTPNGGKPLKRGTRTRAIGRTKSELHSEMHMVYDGLRRPLTFFWPGDQKNVTWRAMVLLHGLPPAKICLGDKVYDASWVRKAIEDKGHAACIRTQGGRKNPASHDRKLYKQRHRIENLLARFKDWPRIATRYDRCGKLFLSAICIAATLMFWLSVLTPKALHLRWSISN